MAGGPTSLSYAGSSRMRCSPLSLSLIHILRELCDAGGAVFFSTHVLEVAEKLCDRVAIIRNGKLVVQGKMADIVGDSSLEEVFLELVEQGK